jgi:hypothetical protein
MPMHIICTAAGAEVHIAASYIGKADFVFPRLDQFEQAALTAAIAERLPFFRIQLF